MAANIVLGATAYTDSQYGSAYQAANAINNRMADGWASSSKPPHWLAVDLGVRKKANSAVILTKDSKMSNFKIQGSNNSIDGADGDWVDLYSGNHLFNNFLQKYSWENAVEYQWYRVYVLTLDSGNYCGISELYLYSDEYEPFMPFMTADNVPAPYVVSANVPMASGYNVYGAFDDKVVARTGVCTEEETPAAIITIDLGAGNEKVVRAYNLMTGYETWSSGRAPKKWTFEGSNDGSSWATLDTQIDVAWGQSAYNEIREFLISNSIAYRYYRLNVTAVQSSDSLEIGMIQLLGSAGAEPPASGGVFFATFI